LLKEHFHGQTTKDPFDDNTIIHIASGCKWPAMATIMSVVDEGLLTLDDKVDQFYPNLFAEDTKNMKLIDMMAHMSGYDLADEWVYGEDKITLQDSIIGIATG
jgi:CubicO group peptidase (beta-lactamase class C family)